MKRIILLLSTLVMAGFIPLSAQTAAFNGWCTNGGKSATVQGLTSSNKLEQIIPSCTVSVYLTGTTTLAPAIYKDAINTPLSNPFTADNLTAVAPGKWLFFAPQNQGYDVVMSGGIAPLTFSSPVTLTDLLVGGGGGGGGGCTPIGLNGVLQASNGVGGCTPAYVQVNGTNLVTPTAPNFIDTATVKVINPGTNQIGFNGVSSSPTIQHNDVTLAGNFSAGTSQILDFNDTTPTPPAGYVNAIFQPDTVTGRLSAYVPSPAGTFVQQLPDPLGTQHVIIYPTGMSTSGTPGNNYGTLTSGLVQTVPQCSGTNNGVISWTYTGALAAQAPWVVPANVTAVYAFGYGGLAVSNTGNNCAPGPNPAPVNYGAGILDNGGRTLMIVNTPTPIFSATELTVLTGATIDTTVGSASISSSGATQSNPFFSVSLLGLIVYYTGTPPPANNAIQIAPPLQYSNATGQPILSLDSTFPQSLSAYSVLKLPPANNYVGRIVSVFDSTDCVTQTGTATSPNNTTCGPVLVGTNYVWAPTTGSGGGGAVSSVSNSDGTLTISPTTGAVVTSLALGHANTWTATQTFSNVKDTGAAAGSGTACLQIDTSGLLSNTGTTCGGGGGGGSNVKVNGGTALTTVNLNSTTPAAGALNQNLAFQVDGSGNTSVEVPYGSASNLGVVKVDGTTITASGGVISAPSNGPVCSGSITLAGATIPGSTAGTNQTVTCTGLLTTDNIMLDFNGSPLSTNGFVPASGGPITIVKYPSANTINVTPVNYNSSSVTLGSITLNYRVVRGGGGGGGYTNVTGSISETTVALINTACGSGTYYATTALSIATGGTITCPVQFSKAGLWTVASGQVVTFAQPVTETDGPNQHFTGSGTAVLAAQNAPVEWWGATGDWNGSSGTDNTTAINACLTAVTGQCVLQAKGYKTTAALTITKSNTGIAGTSNGDTSTPYGSSSLPSYIVNTSASATIIDMAGSSGTSLSGNRFNDFSIHRNATPTGTATGFSCVYSTGAIVNRIISADSVRDFYIKGCPNAWNGSFENSNAIWGYNGVTPSGTVYGWYLDTSAAPNSTYFNQIGANDGTGLTSYGFFTTAGNAATDLVVDGFSGSSVSFGIYVSTGGQNAHFLGVDLDGIRDTGIFANGVTGGTEFRGGWVNGQSPAVDGVRFTSDSYPLLADMQIKGSFSNAAVNISSVGAFIVAHNVIDKTNTGGTGIKVASSIGNVTDNTLSIANSTTAIALTGSSTNSLQGNNIGVNGTGTSTVGISFDATSNNNISADLNTFSNANPPATLLSDAGTGNRLAASNAALTMNNGGSGAASGTTYDGSTARTISYNTIGAAPTASPTFTGTPDASGATQFKLPVGAGFASAANGEVGYDSTNKNWHLWANGADFILAPLAASFTSGHCGQPTSSGGTWTIVDAGGACGVSGGGASFSAITSGTNTTAAMVVGSGATLDVSGTGTINSTKVGGITITGTPSTGMVPTATSSSAATWQASTAGNYVNLCALVTLTNATCSSGLITGGTTPSAITISAIPGTYLHLDIDFDGTVSGSGLAAIAMTVNSDTGSHYLYGRQGTNMVAGTASSGNSGALTTSMQQCLLGGTNEPAGSCHIHIPFYAQAHRKNFHVLNMFGDSANAGGQLEGDGYWNQTTAITSITFTAQTGTFGTGALITIYGEN